MLYTFLQVGIFTFTRKIHKWKTIRCFCVIRKGDFQLDGYSICIVYMVFVFVFTSSFYKKYFYKKSCKHDFDVLFKNVFFMYVLLFILNFKFFKLAAIKEINVECGFFDIRHFSIDITLLLSTSASSSGRLFHISS